MYSLIEGLERDSIPFRRASERDEIYLCCPFCVERGETADARFRLGVNTRTGWAHCFNCNFRTKSFFEMLKERYGLLIQSSNEPAAPPEPFKRPDGFTYLTTYPEEQFLKYLLDRGVTPRQIRRYRFGYSFVGRYKYRVIFPVFRSGKMCYAIGRGVTRAVEPKYLNSPGPKPLVVSLGYQAQTLFLCEGIFKFLAIERVAGSVACCLGHALSVRQFERLLRLKPKRVVMFPDPDPVGLRGFASIARDLSKYLSVHFVWPLPKYQADEYKPTDLARVCSDSRRWSDSLDLEIEGRAVGL